jgi:hypothetical protein
MYLTYIYFSGHGWVRVEGGGGGGLKGTQLLNRAKFDEELHPLYKDFGRSFLG